VKKKEEKKKQKTVWSSAEENSEGRRQTVITSSKGQGTTRLVSTELGKCAEVWRPNLKAMITMGLDAM
jgi:hypothetical protein